MSSRNDPWGVPGPTQHQVLHTLNQLGPATPSTIAEYIGIREGSVVAALSGMRNMFQRHWVAFAQCRSMDVYIITDAGRRALARGSPRLDDLRAQQERAAARQAELEQRAFNRERAKEREAQRRERRIAEGLAWREQVDRERYLYLKKWWDLDRLFEQLIPEFLSLQQRFEPTMSNQSIKYRKGARVLIEVEVVYDQPDTSAITMAIPNRSANPTQVVVPAKAIRNIVNQPLRPGDAVRVYNDENETYITGTLVGKVEGTDQLLVNAYHKAVDDKLPQLFEARHVRYDGAA